MEIVHQAAAGPLQSFSYLLVVGHIAIKEDQKDGIVGSGITRCCCRAEGTHSHKSKIRMLRL